MMEIEEIDAMMQRGEPINPLTWSVEDRLKYCTLVLKYCAGSIEHLLADHFGFDGEYIVTNQDNNVTAFREFDRTMMMGHNVHEVLQSVLEPEVRNKLLKEKIELITGEPVGEIIGMMGNFVIAKPSEEEIPDDLSGLDDGESKSE